MLLLDSLNAMYAADCDQGTLSSMLCPMIMSAAFWGFVWDEATVLDAGPNCGRPASMMCNPSASCPEYSRQDPDEYMDTCAHDMWGVGYLWLRVLGNLTPWSLNATASAGKNWPSYVPSMKSGYVLCIYPELQCLCAADCITCTHTCGATPSKSHRYADAAARACGLHCFCD